MVLEAGLFMGVLAFCCSILLALASKIFHVDEDPRLTDIKSALPGLNCGGCGYAGCEGAAKAILSGKAPVSVCVAGDVDVVQQLMVLTGHGKGGYEPPRATVQCFGSQRLAPLYSYSGARDCRAAALLYGGANPCENGCLGEGTCEAACPFHAIVMTAERLPRIDPDKCRGCGRCVETCPKGTIRLETLSGHLLHLNDKTECLAPCRQKCPAQINVPLFIRHLLQGRHAEALRVIKARNPFPLIVGRVCPHPCENICRRNIAQEAVAIGHLQRYLGEWERQSGKRVPLDCLPDTGRRVAIVGCGPAGLACAYFLRRLGHRPTLFEARSEPGGLLRYGIPEYRLPAHIVDWEIEGILRLGMVLRTEMELGRDFGLNDLKEEGYAAILLALGAWTIPHLCVPGEYAQGVHASLDYLSGVGTRFRKLKGRHVVVIGESNTAMDCARSSIRLGAEAVSVLCPCDAKGVSARKRDVTRALEEGVRIHFSICPLRIVSGATGRVRHVVYRQALHSADESASCAGSMDDPYCTARIKADLVIIAYERKPDLSYLLEAQEGRFGFKVTREENLAADTTTMLAVAPNIFATGDMSTGRATVIGAVAGGRKAARSIHELITTGHIAVPENLQRKINPSSILKKIQVDPGPPRVTLKELPVEARCRSFTEEVVATITERQARTEAARCLQCGTYCYDCSPRSLRLRRLNG